MLLIYTPEISDRSKYIFELLLKDIIGVSFEFTENREDYLNHKGPRFCYGKMTLKGELNFKSVDLLFEKSVKDQVLDYFEWEGLPCIYKVYSESALPFDPFAASFYLVSRYEEYLPFANDRFGRFSASESLAQQKGFLEKPVVNIWAMKIKEVLIMHFPQLSFIKRHYRYIPTYDIDSAYAYKHKGALRTLGGFYRSLKNKDRDEFNERLNVLLNRQKDPFDTFELMRSYQEKYNIKPKYFFLVGEYDEFDKNISIDVLSFQKLIKSISDYAEIGLHPSFASNNDFSCLKQELYSLSDLINREVKISRQHFLKLSFPQTYQRLLELEIEEDYTMGYASDVGFRASICTPFFFYDLDYERKTSLKVFPFAIMDVSLNLYLKLSPEEAIDKSKKVIDEVKAVNGMMITLWHNQNLINSNKWNGWQGVYEAILEYATSG
jgi:hypothetical protein